MVQYQLLVVHRFISAYTHNVLDIYKYDASTVVRLVSNKTNLLRKCVFRIVTGR
jgi:hypothetical protein